MTNRAPAAAPAPPTTAPATTAAPATAAAPVADPAAHTRGGPVHVGVPRFRVTPLPLVALLLILVGAWAGIVAFVGPSFRFGVDGTASWTWNLAHALLALAPGAAAVVAGLWIFAAVPEMAYERRRPLMGLAGLLAMAAGAWLVIGPFVWPVVEGHGYFLVGHGWGLMLRQIGYSFGPGLVIAALGAYALGWASRSSTPVRHTATEAAAAPVPERATVTAA